VSLESSENNGGIAMILRRLELEHYRNYSQMIFETNSEVNIFLGKNAQGKTNLLEAMYVMAIAKSHRTNKDKEFIQWNKDVASIECEVERRYGNVALSLHFTQQGKKAKINGLEQRKLSDFIGTLNAVMFAPEDLSIVKGNPSVRRKFIDMEIGQINPNYIYNLSQYQKIITQRNHFLKTSRPSPSSTLLSVWNEQMAHLAVKITRKRKQFIDKLQVWAEQIHSGITGDKEKLVISYIDSTGTDENIDEAMAIEHFMLKLSQVAEQEVRRGISLLGPHRDDLSFMINDRDVQSFGSQGQQRTTALSLKLAEIELIREEVGEYPILLLDDVLSELDPYRQSHLLKTIFSKVQTFITTTSVDGIDDHTLSRAAVFYVEDGQIRNEK
jgi:DNA replication and repair protein RecF